MPRASVATDNFNRAAPLGANWTNVNSSLGGDVTISASTVFVGEVGSTGASIAAAVWSGAGTFTADQYSKAVFVDTSFGAANYGIGVICRSSTDPDGSRDYYMFHGQSDDVGVLSKVVNGTYTQLHSGAVTWNNGDTVELECEGTTIRAVRNGVALGGSFTQTDSSLSTGKPGISASGDSAVATGDDWEGGNLAAGGSILDEEGSWFTVVQPS